MAPGELAAPTDRHAMVVEGWLGQHFRVSNFSAWVVSPCY
jgi:hypothetical protein